MNETLFTILQGIGVLGSDVLRADALGYTSVLSKQLESVKRRTYDIRYPEFKARQLIPVAMDIDTGAETVVYYQWDLFGMAQVLANYADDLPMVDALVEEYSAKIVPIGVGFSYSVQDIRRATMAGVPLNQQKATASRRATEQKIESMGAIGDSQSAITGIANNANVTLFSPTTGTWSTATGLQMVGDMLNFVAGVVNANAEIFVPNTIVLDITSYNRFATKPVTTSGDSSMTALKFFKESSPYDVEVISWNKLKTADAAGTGPRAICYARTPEVLEFNIPQEYEQFPPQQKNLAFIVPTHARCGGVTVYYPIAMGYMDGL